MVLRADIPCDELRKKYLDEGKSEADIAKEYGCGKSSIGRRRAECGIPTRRGYSAVQIKRRVPIDRAMLERLYVTEEKSEKEIGAIVNHDPRTVRQRLQDHGIPLREQRTHRDRISPETLRRMYIADQRSITSISREFKCAAQVISDLLSEYGIEKRRNRFDGILTKAFLTEMYVDKEVSAKEIAKMVGCGAVAVYRHIRRHGIPTREDHSAEHRSFLTRCRTKGQQRRLEIVEMLGGRCNICQRDKIKLHIHHMCYVPGDIIYDNYPKNRPKYYVDLYDVIVREQWRFRLLCGSCHMIMGKMEQYPHEDVDRMLDIVEEMDAMRATHPTEHRTLLRDKKE